MAYQELSDANFFALVHHVLESSDSNDERRDGRRRSYPRWQYVAPYRNGQLPRAHEFSLVYCRDLSANGFSFVTDELPDCEHVVVALGENPYLFVSAQLMHTALGETDNGHVQHIVGCQFVSRITAPVFGPLLGPAAR